MNLIQRDESLAENKADCIADWSLHYVIAFTLQRVRLGIQLLYRFARPIRFGIVGVSGVVVNSVVLWVLVHIVALPPVIASIVATEVAIINNFFLNDSWTFRRIDSHHSLIQRFLRFNGVSLGGLIITVTALTLLMAIGYFPLLIANLLAIGCATIWNYALNSRWTWGAKVQTMTAETSKNTEKEEIV